jgi:hypothetical protein
MACIGGGKDHTHRMGIDSLNTPGKLIIFLNSRTLIRTPYKKTLGNNKSIGISEVFLKNS